MREDTIHFIIGATTLLAWIWLIGFVCKLVYMVLI
jgi:hypothetical protein